MRTPFLRVLTLALVVSLPACGGSDPAADRADTADTMSPEVAADTDTTTDSQDATPADTLDADLTPDADSVEPDTAADTDTAPDIDTTEAADSSPDAEAPDADTSASDISPDDTSSADTNLADTNSADTSDTPDTSPVRQTLFAEFCPSTPTAPGLYRGTLASNLNDVAGACGLSAPGRDGGVRVNLAPGATVRAAYRHAGDGILYLLDSCPVVASCLASSDASLSGEEFIEWTNTGSVTNPVTIILDSDDLGGPQTFELDLYIDP